jgi:2-C-methyl-D-erythritol 4-phosphate cytidylyltransferase
VQDYLNVAIILAGGKSTRFNQELDCKHSLYVQKLLQPMINGLTVLQNAVMPFAKSECIDFIILSCCNADVASSIKDLNLTQKPIYFCNGGQTRFASLINAIAKLTEVKNNNNQNHKDSNINLLIHDGARPLVSAELIASVQKATALHQTCVVPVVKAVDSVKALQVNTNMLQSKMLNRDTIGLAQTPQGFNFAFLQSCLSKISMLSHEITDDVSIAQLAKQRSYFVDGSQQNIKITNKIDLDIANFLLSRVL